MKKLRVKLKLKRGLKKSEQIGQLVSSCVLEVKSLQNYDQLKLDQKLTKSIMKTVLSVSKQIEGEIDKSAIVKEVLTQVFHLNEEEMKIVEQQIEYIIDEGIHSNVFFKLIGGVVKLATNAMRWVINQ